MAVNVVSPAPERAVDFCGTCMARTGADVVPVCEASDLCWDKFLCGGSVAELSVGVVPPAPEGAVGFGCARMARAGADVVPC